MKLKITFIILTFSLLACVQKSNKQKVDPDAVRLNNRAMNYFPYIENKDSSDKMIKLLDSATAIDSNYFLGYYNKQLVLNQLKQYDKSIVALHNLIRLKPYAVELYLNSGILYEITGDTTSSQLYFQKSQAICKTALDTMNVNNQDYDMVASNMALSLIMLGHQIEGNELLKKVYQNQTDGEQKAMTKSHMNKSKRELIDMITNPKTQDSESVHAKLDN